MHNLFKIDKHDLLIAILASFSLIAYVAAFTYIYFAKDLQSVEGIMNRNNTGLILTDRHGTPFFRFYEANYKKTVPISEISSHLKNAIIAAEDKDFYNHPGFSIPAMIAAMVANIKHQDLAYGGSTITQQLVKNSLLTSEKSFLRKYQEIVLAQEIERRYSKDQILEMYLNSVYFGEGAFGAESAAKVYFNKTAKDLNLAESSVLAGLLTAPTELSPLNGNENKALERQKYVLSRMKELKFIDDIQKEQTEKEKLSYASSQQLFSYKAPHFALWVRDQLIEKYGEETVIRSGFTVKTTIDLEAQEFTQKTVEEQVKNLARNNATNGAAVVMDPKTGEILALAGSKNWADEENGKINMAVSPRQPGSSFKPIVYAKGLEEKIITPGTLLKDEKTTFMIDPYSPPYSPNNYDGKFRGPVLPRRALANSLNIPSVQIMDKVGVNKGLASASEEFGIKNLKDSSNYGLSLVLGAAEVSLVDMTGAYGVFANQGKYTKPTAILEIQDKYGSQVYSYKVEPKQVLSQEVAFLISSFLSDKNARREMFGATLDIPKTAAVKTGTTENYRDALTLGYTPSLVIGVWVGNNDNKPMDQVAGSLGAAPIWKNLMIHFLANKPDEIFAPPPGVIAINICNNGMRAISGGYTEFFIKGTEPTGVCNEKREEEKKEDVKNKEEEQKKKDEDEKRRREEEEKKRFEEVKNNQKPPEERSGQGGTTIEIQIIQSEPQPTSSP